MRLHVERTEDRSPENDAELDAVTAYCGGFMSETEEQAFETRLAEDEAFFERVAPVLQVWHERVPARPVRRRVAKPAWQRPRWVGGLALAAAAVIAVMVFGPLASRTSNGGAIDAAREDSILNALRENGTLAKLPEPAMMATGANETQMVTFAGGTRVTLAPKSWIAFAGPAGMPAMDAPAVAMGGNVQVEVPIHGRAFRVLTGAGVATLRAGQWALKGLGKTQGFVRIPGAVIQPKH